MVECFDENQAEFRDYHDRTRDFTRFNWNV